MIHGAPYVMMMARGQTTITEWHAGTLCSESSVPTWKSGASHTPNRFIIAYNISTLVHIPPALLTTEIYEVI